MFNKKRLFEKAEDIAAETGKEYLQSGLGIMTAVKYFIYFVMAAISTALLAGLIALFN